MTHPFARHLHHLGPAMPAPARAEFLRAPLGAALGIGVCALLALALPVKLVAPLGATAFLIFAVPNAPLAQPWSAIVGNTVAAGAALAVVAVAPPALAPMLAIGAAILVMMLARALHPPGGAVALLLALDPSLSASGPAAALLAVSLPTAALVLAGTLFNRATGRVYPFRQPGTAPEQPRLGLGTGELAALIERFNQGANIGVADLGRLLAAAEAEAARHRFRGVTCGDVMTTDLITATPDMPLDRVAALFRAHPIKSLPVVSASGRFRGLILQSDLVEALLPQGAKPRPRRLTARHIMQPPADAVPHDMPVGELLNRLARQGVQTVPVTRQGRLAGVLTRSDILGLLLEDASDRSGYEAAPTDLGRTPEKVPETAFTKFS
ncbi:HPP family protein [Halovulum sp. GXIMD14794]